jgi:hypothetical protein
MTLAVKYDTTTGRESPGYITKEMLGFSVEDDKHYIHEQGVASEVWAVAHNLGKRPSVSVTNTSHNLVYGYVDHLDDNNLTVTFKYATAGKAYCN